MRIIPRMVDAATNSDVLNELLREAQVRARKWAEENADAIKTNNARVERFGLWHKGLTPWYYEAQHG